MHDEIFDVVNERDEVIGRASRREVHERGLMHRAVHVLVWDPAGRVFLQQRSLKKDTFPGAWDSSASGHLDAGEDYDACALRELREELGLWLPEAPRRLFHVRACVETGHEHVWVYQTRHPGPFTLAPDEIQRGEWFAPEEIDAWIERASGDFASAFVLIWRRLRSGSATRED